MVTRRFEVGIKKAVTEIGATSLMEVHSKKGGVTQDVNPAKRVVEFNSIKGHEAIIPLNNVGGVEIPVTFANEPADTPLRERNLMLVKKLARPFLHPVEFRLERVSEGTGTKVRDIVERIDQDRMWRSPGHISTSNGRVLVKQGNGRGQLFHFRQRQQARLQSLTQK